MSQAVLKDRFKCIFQKSGNTSDSVADEMAQAVAEYMGNPGGAGKTDYVHNQGTPATAWTINHNLNRPVASVMITDSAGTTCMGEVIHTDPNTTILKFGAQFAGKAVIL